VFKLKSVLIYNWSYLVEALRPF